MKEQGGSFRNFISLGLPPSLFAFQLITVGLFQFFEKGKCCFKFCIPFTQREKFDIHNENQEKVSDKIDSVKAIELVVKHTPDGDEVIEENDRQ